VKIASDRKNIALFPAHPSQIWILKQIADEISEFANVHWVMRDKDISLKLAALLGIEYTTFSKASKGIFGNGLELLRNIKKVLAFSRKNEIDLWISTYGAAHIASFLNGKKSIVFIDDDIDIVPLVAWTSLPFADSIIATKVTRLGRFSSKAVRFEGNLELIYLHPKRFTPDDSIYDDLGIEKGRPYAIIRLSALTAHHDVGKKGIADDVLDRAVSLISNRMRLFITSEKPLTAKFEQFRMPIPPHRIHHALAFADLFLGDSQTMTSEAAVLGTPAFRISDFVGKISYVEEHQRLGLAFGYKPNEGDRLLHDLRNMLDNPQFKQEYSNAHRHFIERTSDPLPYFIEVVKGLI